MKFGSLIIKLPGGQTREFALDQPSVAVGRAESNGLVVDHTSISRRHARLSVESGRLMIEDYGSSNGTFINSQRLPPNTPSWVVENAVLRLGEVEMRYVPPPIDLQPPSLTAAATAAPIGSPINVSLVGPAQPVMPGSLTTATLTVQNRGAVVDELIVTISGVPAEWVRLSKERASLLPNAQEQIVITLQPPRRPEATAADHPFVVTVTSREHGVSETARNLLKVQPFQGFAVNLQPQRSRRDFQLIVNNQGNAPTAYRFSGVDDEQALDFHFGQDAVSLQPGQQGSIPLQVTPKIKPKVGTRETRAFNVIAAPLDASAVETRATGQLMIRPPIPPWLIPLVLVLTLFVCAGAALAYTQICPTLGSNAPLCPSNSKPVINVFVAKPNEIEKAGTITLSWDVSNADKVELIAPVQDTLVKSGVKAYDVAGSTSFTLMATNFAGSVKTTISVQMKNSPPLVQSFKADPPVVTGGKTEKVVLSWVVVGADSVSVEGIPGSNRGMADSVEIDAPEADKTYNLIAINAAGQTKQQVTVRVSSAGCALTTAADMREGPSAKYNVIDSLPAGMLVSPVGRNGTGEWLRVQANKEGWVNAAAIKCNLTILDFATISPAEIPLEPTSSPTPTATPTNPPPSPPSLSEIDKKYAALGGAAGILGKPSGPESIAPDGVGHYRHFEVGSIYWTQNTGAFVVQGLIRDKWAALGWETSILGYPITDELVTPDNRGRFNHFQGGSIYWTPETGAFEVQGLIRDKWASLGWENSPLGYPISDEEPSTGGWDRQSRFEHGIIRWSSAQGAVVFLNP